MSKVIGFRNKQGDVFPYHPIRDELKEKFNLEPMFEGDEDTDKLGLDVTAATVRAAKRAEEEEKPKKSSGRRSL